MSEGIKYGPGGIIWRDTYEVFFVIVDNYLYFLQYLHWLFTKNGTNIFVRLFVSHNLRLTLANAEMVLFRTENSYAPVSFYQSCTAAQHWIGNTLNVYCLNLNHSWASINFWTVIVKRNSTVRQRYIVTYKILYIVIKNIQTWVLNYG